MAKKILIDNLDRKQQYYFFKDFVNPLANVCVQVDITVFYQTVKRLNLSMYPATIFAITLAANEIPQLKQRFRENYILQHDYVRPSFTVISDDELYNNCSCDFSSNWEEFIVLCKRSMEEARNNSTFNVNNFGSDDIVFMTCLPWFSFTSIEHPVKSYDNYSVPSIAWGKFYNENGKTYMPVALQGNHALMDGIHIAKFYKKLNEVLVNPMIFENK